VAQKYAHNRQLPLCLLHARLEGRRILHILPQACRHKRWVLPVEARPQPVNARVEPQQVPASHRDERHLVATEATPPAGSFTSTHRRHFTRSGVRQLPPTGSEEVATTLISVIRAADPETSAHYLGGIPHTAGLPQGR
jgi:hypothetical protein